MGAPKPTLGFPSRTDAVIALRAQGLSSREISEQIGISTATITALEHSAGRSERRKRRPAEEHGRTVLFPTDVLNALAPHAARRGMHINALARLIVETVVDDEMVDAVLDDADDPEGWA